MIVLVSKIRSLTIATAAAAALSATGFTAATAAPIRPFGLVFGAPLSTARPTQKVAPGTWAVKPPRPSSTFEGYQVEATAQTGICVVTAFSHPDNEPLSMDQTFSVYDATLATLTELYGTPSIDEDSRKSKDPASKAMPYPIGKPDLPWAMWLSDSRRDVAIRLSVINPRLIALSYNSLRTKECRDIIEASVKANARRGL
jgi:hypothetical protein